MPHDRHDADALDAYSQSITPDSHLLASVTLSPVPASMPRRRLGLAGWVRRVWQRRRPTCGHP
ncbi:hypothetical protein [Mycobacterium uberis]|uniref:hypothetical protein n=1 Tax=Mycobacterium uberis TaxID=2162698 RepID=UPI0010587146|nr:hypothetical protein [Mycobacterium uberis]